jgi:hypothetical protein
MGDQHPVPEPAQLFERVGYRAQRTRQGCFEQHPAASVRAVGHQPQLVGVESQHVAGEQLGPGSHGERDALREQQSTHRRDPAHQRAHVDEARMWGGNDQPGAVGRCVAREGNRSFGVTGTVVDPGQEMEMQLDPHTSRYDGRPPNP